MTTSAQFAEAIRRGKRAGGRSVVVYLVPASSSPPSSAASPSSSAPSASSPGQLPIQVGFVVGKTVGNSVIRHRVLRQMRAHVASRLPSLTGADALVVRALPSAAGASTAELGAQIDRAIRKAAS